MGEVKYQLMGDGSVLDLENPSFFDVPLLTIAQALSHVCRYGGHTKYFYSVAEHSCRVAMLVSDKHRLTALMHDVTEIITSDIPSSVKNLIPEIRLFENTLWAALGKKYKLPISMPAEVKEADALIVMEESMHLMPRVITAQELGLIGPKEIPKTGECMPFMETHPSLWAARWYHEVMKELDKHDTL